MAVKLQYKWLDHKSSTASLVAGNLPVREKIPSIFWASMDWRRVDWRRVDWRTVLVCSTAVLLLLILSWPVLSYWFGQYTLPDSYYAHGFFILPVVILMFWHRRAALQIVPKKPCWGALLLLVPALALLVFTTRIFTSSLNALAFLVIVWSSVWLVLGTSFLRVAAFPLGYLLLMAPLPNVILTDSTQHLQILSTVFAGHLLRLVSFQASVIGNEIFMDHFTLLVAVPCSGFKALLSFLTVTAALAFLLDGSPFKRLCLFLISLPLSLAVNAVRIALIAVVGECIGPIAAHHFHDWSGCIVLLVGTVTLLGFAKGFGCHTFAGWPLFS